MALRHTLFFAPAVGGVMTEKADVVTVELELPTHPSEAADGGLEVLVYYVGAEEWYTVSGSPVRGVASTFTRCTRRCWCGLDRGGRLHGRFRLGDRIVLERSRSEPSQAEGVLQPTTPRRRR